MSMTTLTPTKKHVSSKHAQIHLGHSCPEIHVQGRSQQGVVTFDSTEDFILTFSEPPVFGTDMAFVKAGVPLSMPVLVNTGITKYWVRRPAAMMTFLSTASTSMISTVQTGAPVAGSPNDIIVP
jgi:hypothetical protein